MCLTASSAGIVRVRGDTGRGKLDPGRGELDPARGEDDATGNDDVRVDGRNRAATTCSSKLLRRALSSSCRC